MFRMTPSNPVIPCRERIYAFRNVEKSQIKTRVLLNILTVPSFFTFAVCAFYHILTGRRENSTQRTTRTRRCMSIPRVVRFVRSKIFNFAVCAFYHSPTNTSVFFSSTTTFTSNSDKSSLKTSITQISVP